MARFVPVKHSRSIFRFCGRGCLLKPKSFCSRICLTYFYRVYNRLKKALGCATSYSKAEALMNVHVIYRLPKSPVVEKDVQHQIEKLQKRLQVYRPELIHLRGVVE